MFREECKNCDSDPCLCEKSEFSTFLVGEESLEYIGFSNLESENNCFLSTALQALLSTFPFVQILSEPCPQTENSSISCLRKLEKDIQVHKANGEKKIILHKYREALSAICGNGRFNVGEQGDSMEAIEVILFAIHCDSTDGRNYEENFNVECATECHAHTVVYNKLLETTACPCRSSRYNLSMSFILKLNSTEFFSEVPSATFEIFRETFHKDLGKIYGRSLMKNLFETFPRQFKKQFSSEVFCETCKVQTKNQISLKSSPKVMIFQISWENYYSPKLVNLLQVLISLKGNLSMEELFDEAEEISMGLRGMIVFLQNHYAYFAMGNDFRWYRVDDDLCQSIGIGRWYDVLLIMLFMKGVPVGLIYEEFHVADLSLYKLELLHLEKTVYSCINTSYQEAGSLELYADYSINPVKKLSGNPSGQVDCVNCKFPKEIGEICTFCNFNPQETDWKCKKCQKLNDGFPLLCDWCDNIRFKIPFSQENCGKCKREKEFRVCLICDFVCMCEKCKKKISPAQNIYCRQCKEICRDGYCRNCEKYEMVCKKCESVD